MVMKIVSPGKEPPLKRKGTVIVEDRAQIREWLRGGQLVCASDASVEGGRKAVAV